mgnify:CR=1 FL=1
MIQCPGGRKPQSARLNGPTRHRFHLNYVFCGSWLPISATLTSLDLGFNDLDEEAALSIVRVERQRNKLTTLGLARCNIGPTGAKEIAEWVSVSATLTELRLESNSIGDEAVKAIGDALRVNGALTSLDVRRNQLDEAGEGLLRDAVNSKDGFELQM